MQLTRFAVFSALAALAAAAPRHHQTTINKATSSASVLFQDPCWLVCWADTTTCPTGWYSRNQGTATSPCWTCCMSPTYVASTPTASSALKVVDVNAQDSCLKVCWCESVTCPEGWYSYNYGNADAPCWTCCKSPTYVASTPTVSYAPKTNSEVDVNAQDICLRVCWHDSHTCPEGWYSNNFGSADEPCWTCCRTPDAGAAIAAAASEDFCWRACFPEEQQCPQGMTARKFGEGCWTCCAGSSDGAVGIAAAALVPMHHAPAQQPPDVCWRVCFPEAPTCPEGWTAKQLGSCWTCCLDSEEEEGLLRGIDL